ncbi:hypothetical protein PHLCEN_2v7223 [Hermanssonia centrifuga]|uniref:Uncharacterized protein n=1 Tax=Hermanssonia centrifuga TaxID=98765 RepID=A0A2R6NXE1_9APHY|nr:hypothetical protein PHLCEN_2v7223 [Hermanssonia centrifuga]
MQEIFEQRTKQKKNALAKLRHHERINEGKWRSPKLPRLLLPFWEIARYARLLSRKLSKKAKRLVDQSAAMWCLFEDRGADSSV